MQTMFEQDDSGASLTPHWRSANPPWRGQGLGGHGFDRDVQFVDMLNAYRRSGGLARATDICAAMQPADGRNIAILARWIVQREVIHFDWQGDTWLPVFQFGSLPRQPKAAVGRVIAELVDAMQAWELAQWFATPNPGLDDRRPADVLSADPMAVIRAARASRSVDA